MSQPNIKVYSSKFCGYCMAAERLLKSKGLDYEVIKVDEDPKMFDHMIETSGRRSVPQIFIGDHHVGGFDDLLEINQTGELNELLKKES